MKKTIVLAMLCFTSALAYCAATGVAGFTTASATSDIIPAAEAVLTSITPAEIEAASLPQTKVFTIYGSGLGFGRAMVTFTGPREDAVRSVFAFSLNTRVVAIVVIAANPEPGTYAVTVKRGAIEATGVSLTITGNDQTTTTTVPGGVSRCVPCGDFIPQCDLNCLANYNTTKNCPVCMNFSDNGSVLIRFEDGSSFATENDVANGKTITTYKDNTGKVCVSAEYDWSAKEMVMYDHTGHICYTVKTTSTGEGQFILNGKTYTLHEDGSWTCPDGRTWTMPEGCTNTSTIDEPDQQCPVVTELPRCSE